MTSPFSAQTFKRKNLERLLLPVLLLAMVLLGIIQTLLSVNPAMPEVLPNRSIHNNANSGYRAWHQTVKKAGLPVFPWIKPFSDLKALPEPVTMLLVEPYTVAKSSIVFGKKEAQALLQWVQKGNTVILLDDFQRSGSQEIAQQLDVIVTQNAAGSSAMQKTSLSGNRQSRKRNLRNRYNRLQIPLAATSRQKLLGTYLYRPIMSQTLTRLEHAKTSVFKSTTLLEDRTHQPLALRISYGKGTFILGTPVDLGDNAYLNQPANDNYQFLSNLLLSEQNTVFINEFVHGTTESGNLLAYYQNQTPLGAIFSQCVLAFILMLWFSFASQRPKPGEPVTVGIQEGPSGLSAYINSMARLYLRTQSASLALSPQLHRIRTLLNQRFQISLDVEDASLQETLALILPADTANKAEADITPLQALQKAMAAVQRQEKLKEQELLQLSRMLTLIEERLQHHGHRTYAIR